MSNAIAQEILPVVDTDVIPQGNNTPQDIEKLTASLKSRLDGRIKALGDAGADVLALTLDVVQHGFHYGEWSMVARLIQKAEGLAKSFSVNGRDRRDLMVASNVKLAIRTLVPLLRVEPNPHYESAPNRVPKYVVSLVKDKATGLKPTDVDAKGLAKVQTLIDHKVPIYSARVKAVLAEPKAKPQVTEDVAVVLKRQKALESIDKFTEKMHSEGLSDKDILARIAPHLVAKILEAGISLD